MHPQFTFKISFILLPSLTNFIGGLRNGNHLWFTYYREIDASVAVFTALPYKKNQQQKNIKPISVFFCQVSSPIPCHNKKKPQNTNIKSV